METKREFDPNSQAYHRRSHELFAHLRQDDPVSQQGTLFNRPVWYITRYEEVETVLRDSDTFALDFRLAFDPDALAKIPQEPQVMAMVNNHLLTKEGESHTRLRSLVNKAFTPRIVAGMRPRIQAIADELLDRVEGQGKMDLVEAYAFPLHITVIAELLGIPPEDRYKFRKCSDMFVSSADGEEGEDTFMQSAMGFVNYLGRVFEERRKEPKEDLISALLQAEEAGDQLSTEEMFSMVVLLIIAGHETTVTLIGNAVVALLEHPEVMERLAAHPEDMPQAVEEFLRYDSPVSRALTRWVSKDVILCGKTLKRGDVVIPVIGSANRDEAHFENPHRLDIDRDNRQHMAFGRGAHYCLGAPLARLEGEIALNTLLRRLPDMKLAVPVEELEFRLTPLFRAYQHIPVVW